MTTMLRGGRIMNLLNELENPEVEAALVGLLRKLPDIEKKFQSLEDMISFGQAVLNDKETIAQVEERVSMYHLNGETIHALISLLEKLPQLVKLVNQIDEIQEFVSSVLKDDASLSYLIHSIKEYTDPLASDGKKTLEFIDQVKERADANPKVFSVFSALKILKDPSVQKALNYAQAGLDILGEKNK